MKSKYSNKYVIETGIGLQDVDKLKNSKYFINESQRYIKGEISLKELDEIVTEYYQSKPDVEERSEEADKISIRIAEIISEDSFTFTVGQLLTIHKILFSDIIEHAGKLRTYNFTKKEWVLDGASVTYGDYRELEAILNYDFDLERRFNYSNISLDEIIEHLATFIANLWQIHAFEEGNTRAVAVFTIKYLRKLGFDVTNDTFAKNAWYFRNSLVRANYSNVLTGVFEDRSYLIKFLRNLLLGENNVLANKELRVNLKSEAKLGTREIRIIELMKAAPKIKAEEIAKELGVSLRTIRSIVATMEKDGIIRRMNGKKYGYWELIE